MSELNGGALVLDYLHQACSVCHGTFCGGICEEIDLLETTSGKTRSHFQLVQDQAIKQEFDDLIVLVTKSNGDLLKKLQKKRKSHKLRVTIVEVPRSHVSSQADGLKALAAKYGPLLAKGFVYINAHSLPTANLRQALDSFRKATRKNGFLALTLLSMRNAGSQTAQLVVYDKKTEELIGLECWNPYKADHKFDVRRFCKENQRVTNLSQDNGCVTSEDQVSFCHFVANSKLLEGLNSNPDFENVRDFVADALFKPVALDTINLMIVDDCSTTRNYQLSTIRAMRSLVNQDAISASDAIELEGNRSYWKKRGSSVVHESVRLPEEEYSIDSSVLMKDVTLAETITICNCVIGSRCLLRAACVDAVIEPNSVINTPVTGPCCVGPKQLFEHWTGLPEKYPDLFTECKDYDDAHYELRCSDLWRSIHLASNPKVYELLDDPTKCFNSFLDELFDIQNEDEEEESSSLKVQHKACDADGFSQEVVEILNSGELGHMSDLILELRSLRLSENKKDSDLMRPLGYFMAQKALTSCPNRPAAITAYLESSELLRMVEAFCTDEICHHELYSGVVDALTRPDSSIDAKYRNSPEAFVSILSALNDTLSNEEYLKTFVSDKAESLPEFMHNALIQGYIDWLEGSDEDDESDAS